MVRGSIDKADKEPVDHPVRPDLCIYAKTCKYATGDAGPIFEICDGVKPNCRMYRPQVDTCPVCTACDHRGKCTRCKNFASWVDWHREQRLKYMQEHNVGAYP